MAEQPDGTASIGESTATGAALYGGAGAALGLFSGIVSYYGASQAARAETNAMREGLAAEYRQAGITDERTAPYRAAGERALWSMGDMMGVNENPYDAEIAKLQGNLSGDYTDTTLGQSSGIMEGTGPMRDLMNQAVKKNLYETMSGPDKERLESLIAKRDAFNNRQRYDYQNQPGYQFRLSEGMKALERSQAGRRLGGRATKEAQRYGQEYASGEFQNQFSRLGTIAGFGPQGISQSQADNPNVGGYYQGIGNAAAGKALAGNQAIQSGLSNYMTWDTYNKGSDTDDWMNYV